MHRVARGQVGQPPPGRPCFKNIVLEHGVISPSDRLFLSACDRICADEEAQHTVGYRVHETGQRKQSLISDENCVIMELPTGQ